MKWCVAAGVVARSDDKEAVMVDYQIQSGIRQCCITGRVLEPGEPCHSVLLEEGARLVRRDYSREAWQGPPEGAVGYWQGRAPSRDPSRKPVIDDDVLMECFTRLEGQQEPSQISFRYVVSLLLMRRKRLKFEDVLLEDEREVLCLRCPTTKAVHHVVNPALSDEEIAAVQDEVFKVIGWR
jgi:hypothetical protein